MFIPGSYDEEKDKALESIRFWRGSIIKSFFEVYCHDPRRIEEYAQIIGDYTLENMALVISNTEEVIKKLQNVQLGFTEIVVVNSCPDRNTVIRGTVKIIEKVKSDQPLQYGLLVISKNMIFASTWAAGVNHYCF